MDTRSAVCTLVAHDVVLGPMLDTGSNGRRHGRHPLRGIPVGAVVVLEWTARQGTCATARPSLTVRVHLPRRQLADRPFPDFLLHRVRALLTTGTIIVGNGRMLDVRYRGTSHEFVAGDVDTIYKCCTFQVSVCRVRDRSTRLQLVQ